MDRLAYQYSCNTKRPTVAGIKELGREIIQILIEQRYRP